MAHIAKYKAHSVGHMLAHYRRDPSCFQRDNIDRERVPLDYTIGLVTHDDGKRFAERVDWQPSWDTVERRIERVDAAAVVAGKRRTRKDAVVLADLVITLPENVPEKDAERFFAQTYIWLGSKLGRENLMGGFVHRDEVRTGAMAGEPVRDHMHVPFTPILDGRFNYKQLVPRAFYQTLHKELGDYLEGKLGYRPEIALDEDKKAERALSQVRKEDIDVARDAIIAPAAERAESMNNYASECERRASKALVSIERNRAAVEEAEAELESVKAELSAERDRLECLRQATDTVAEHVEQLETIAAEARGFESKGRHGKLACLARIVDGADRFRAAFDRGFGAVQQMISRLRAKFVTTYKWDALGNIHERTEMDLSSVKTNRIEKKFDLSSKVQEVTRAHAAQDRARAVEQSRAAAQEQHWDLRSNRGRGR